MIKYFLYAICAFFVFLCISCSDSGSFGLSTQPSEDGIILGTDTFHINSISTITGANSSPMACSSDSLLLGEYYDPTFGTTRGEILAQFTTPTTFNFPAGITTQADSMSLTLVFNTWKGNKHSPVQISAYEMDLGTLDYNKTYYTTEDPATYCSRDSLLGSRISVAVPDTITDTTTYQPHLTYKFSPKLVNRFATACKNGFFASQTDFSNFFKGIYLRSDYGDGSIWNISYLYMTLYYHYHAFVSNKDTTLTSGLVFPASKDVRQISLATHKNINSTLASIPDTVTYITSPAGIYTQVNIPVGQILNKAKQRFGSKVINFNHAGMTVEVTNRDTTNAYALSPPPYLMLARNFSNMDVMNYIKNYSYSTDTLIIAAYNSTTHTYTFDLASLLTYRLHKTFSGETIPADYVEKMALVPIIYTLASSSSSTITSIRQQPTLSAVQVRNKQCRSPLRINIFYNGF